MARLLNLEDLAFSVFEPKVQNRWFITLPEEFGLSKWVLHSSQRPIITSDNYDWVKPIKINFYDPINPSTTRKLWELYVGMGYGNGMNYGNEFMSESLRKEFIQKFEKFKSGFDYTLEMLDPTGVAIETWTIKDCNITEIDFGELSFNSDKPAICSMTVQPRKVILNF